MLAGAPPFHGRTPHALLAAQLTELPAPLASRRYDVDPSRSRRSSCGASRRTRPSARRTRPTSCTRWTTRASSRAMRMGGRGPQAAAEAVHGDQVGRARHRGGGGRVGPARSPSRRPGSSCRFRARRPQTARTPPATRGEGRRTGPERSPRAGRGLFAVFPPRECGRQCTGSSQAAEGITSELATAISRVPGVRVSSQPTAAAVRQSVRSPARQPARSTPTMLIEGTVQRAQVPAARERCAS